MRKTNLRPKKKKTNIIYIFDIKQNIAKLQTSFQPSLSFHRTKVLRGLNNKTDFTSHLNKYSIIKLPAMSLGPGGRIQREIN